MVNAAAVEYLMRYYWEDCWTAQAQWVPPHDGVRQLIFLLSQLTESQLRSESCLLLAWSCAQSSTPCPSGAKWSAARGRSGEVVPRPALTFPALGWPRLGPALRVLWSLGNACWHLLGLGFPLALPRWGKRTVVGQAPARQRGGTWWGLGSAPESQSPRTSCFEKF